MAEQPQVRTVQDTRRPAYGLGRILVGVFAAMGLVIFFPALVALLRQPHIEPVVMSVNLVGGLLYLLLAVCVAHNGRRMRNIGWMALAALATMAGLIGALTLFSQIPELENSVWARAGAQLHYLPAILPLLAAVWMWLSDPRRIVLNAERMTELSDSLAESLERTRPAVKHDARAEARVPSGQGPDHDA